VYISKLYAQISEDFLGVDFELSLPRENFENHPETECGVLYTTSDEVKVNPCQPHWHVVECVMTATHAQTVALERV
jgi:hypothetical protein